jgi:8-oxo-dGTP diphosphatase
MHDRFEYFANDREYFAADRSCDRSYERFNERSNKVSKMPPAFQSYKPRHMKVYGSIIINNEGEVLLVHGRLSNKWSFPKGHCKRGETDLQCAMRELFEETGLVLNEKYTSYHKLKGGSYFVFGVNGRPTGHTKEKFRDNHEIDEISWFSLKDITGLLTNVDVSIFNTLMKNLQCGTSVNDYMDSPEIQSRALMITRSIA